MEKLSVLTEFLQPANLEITKNTAVISIISIVLIGFALFLLWQAILIILNFHKKLYISAIQFPSIDHVNNENVIGQMTAIFSAIQGSVLSSTNKVFLEILKTDKYITIQLGSNKEEILNECKRLFSQMENVSITERKEDKLQNFKKLKARTMYASKDFLPVNKNVYFFDGILNYLSSLPEDKQAGIQIILRGVNKKFSIEKKIIGIEQRVKRENRRITEREHMLLQMYQQKGSENLFKAKINIFSSDKKELKSIKSLFQTLNLNNNTWYSYPVWLTCLLKTRFIAHESLFDVFPVYRERSGSYLTGSELAYLIHPTNTKPSRYNPQQQKEIDAAPEFLEEREDNIPLGTVQTHENEKQPVFFSIKNFKRHFYLIGKTGRGKSTLLISLIVSLIKKKAGTIFVLDPHADLIKDIIGSISKEGIACLPLSQDLKQIFTTNLLFKFQQTEYEKASTRDMLLDILKSETDDEGGSSNTGVATLSRIKTVIEIGIEFPDAYYKYLTEKKKIPADKAGKIIKERQITLNDLPYIYTKEMGYAEVMHEVFDGVNTELGRYIRKSLDNHLNQFPVAEAIQTRLKQLLHPSISLICEGNSFDLEKAVTSGKTFLIPIPEDIYGSRGQRALLKMMLSLIWLSKRKVPEQKRKDTYIFIDELQRAQISIIPSIIAEARKYKLYLILANQHLGQLIDEIRDAIAGNIGTIVAFTLGPGEIGAELISKVFGKRVQEEDLLNLPSYSAYLQTEDENHHTLARFTFQTIKSDIPALSKEKETQLAEKSLKEYGEDKAEIRERLNKKQENPYKYFTEGI